MIVGQLPTPLPYINDVITQVAWRVTYPENIMYYELQNSYGLPLTNGNWSVPKSVTDVWYDDDSIVTNALIAAQPWVVPPPPQPETTTTTTVEETTTTTTELVVE
jgi:hypothetical protein